PREPSRIDQALIPLGLVSYSLYLWHQPIVGELCARIVRSPRALEAVGPAGLFFIALGMCAFVSLVAAVGAYRLIEVPSIAWAKQWAKLLERDSARAATSPAADSKLPSYDYKKAA